LIIHLEHLPHSSSVFAFIKVEIFAASPYSRRIRRCENKKSRNHQCKNRVFPFWRRRTLLYRAVLSNSARNSNRCNPCVIRQREKNPSCHLFRRSNFCYWKRKRN